MGAVAETAGIPAVAIVAPELVDLVRTAAQAQGIPSMATAEFPYEVMAGAIEDVHPSCGAVIEDIVHGLTEWEEREAEGSKKYFVFEGKDYQDAAAKSTEKELIKSLGAMV